MIDTIFFLLVFFMMSTLSMVKMGGLGLGIPRVAAKGAGKAPARITLSIDPSGQFFVDKRKVDLTSLPQEFQRELSAHPGATVVVNVAATQKTQTLVSTLDILNEIMAEAHNESPILVVTPKTKDLKVETGSIAPDRQRVRVIYHPNQGPKN